MHTANLKNLISACILFSFMVSTASGDIIVVNPGKSIQAAIDDANDGDDIEVAPGTYNEAINFNGKVVRLYSSGGPEVTTIDANGAYHVVQCVSGEDANTILEGFTITGGNANGPNPNDKRGGGMVNNDSNPTVTDCKFTVNTAKVNAGGMYNYNSHPTVTNCTFKGNTASSVTHGGAGIWNHGSSPTVTNCTVTGNTATTNGGGMYNYTNSYPTVTNCILWGNTPGEIFNNAGNATVTYSDVQGGYTGTGNIDADPCFVDAVVGYLRLSPGSPCIDAGDKSASNLEPNDLDGHPRIIDGDCDEVEVVDIGAYEFNYAYMGDLDYNCSVDFFDFSIFGRAWEKEQGDPDWDWACDMSDPPDDYIDWIDVAILCDNWLAQIP